MKHLSHYLITADYFNLLADYIQEWSNLVPTTIGSQKLSELSVCIRQVKKEYRNGRYELVLSMITKPVSGEVAQLVRDSASYGQRPDEEFVESKIIEGANCFKLRAYGYIGNVGVSSDDDSVIKERTIIDELKHIFVVRFDFIVKEKSVFEIRKET